MLVQQIIASEADLHSQLELFWRPPRAFSIAENFAEDRRRIINFRPRIFPSYNEMDICSPWQIYIDQFDL